MKINKKVASSVLLVGAMLALATTESSGTELSYINDLRSNDNTVIESTSDAELVKLGTLTCDSFNADMTGDQVVQTIANTGYYDTDEKIEFLGLVITTAIERLCPEYIEGVK